jgi:hypothetical protein
MAAPTRMAHANQLYRLSFLHRKALAMIDTVLAWSWDGHGRITALALAAAINQLILLGKSDLMKRIYRLFQQSINVLVQEYGSSGSHLYKDLEKVPVPSADQSRNALNRLMVALPGKVQETDIHLGNIPWGIGEFLDSNGQVRHFMRSTAGTAASVAFVNSMGWIRNHLTDARRQFEDALYKDYGIFTLSSNLEDFYDGVTNLAEGLHTVEDSYAPGHVQRSPSLHNIIQDIHYWDKENKEAHGDWPGHEALDNPDNPKSRDFFESAKTTTTELIVCVFASLDDPNERNFASSLQKKLNMRFMLALGSSDVSLSRGDGILA